MSLNGGGELFLGASFGGQDVGLKPLLDTIASSFDKMKASAKDTKEELKATFAEYKAGVAIVKDAYSKFKQLDKFANLAAPLQSGLKELKLFSGATSDELARVKGAALGADTVLRGFNANDAIEAMKIMAQVTGSTTTAVKLLNPALELAKIAGVDAATAGESLARTIKKFGLEAEDASRVNDILVLGIQKFGLLSRDVVPVLDTLNAAAGRSKTSFEDTALSAFLVGKNIGDIKEGATIAAAAVKFFAETGNEKVRNFVRSGRDGTLSLLAAYEKLAARFPNATTGLNQFRNAAVAAAGPQGARALVNIYEQLDKAAKESGGTFKNGRAVLAALRGDLKSTEGQAAQLALGLVSAQSVTTNAWKNIWIAIADPLRTALKPIHQAFARISLAILDFVNSIPGPVKDAIAGFIVFGLKMLAAFGAFVALKAGISFVFVLLKGLIPLIITTGVAFLVAFGPVIAQFLLAVAVFEAFRLAYEQNLGGFGDFVKGAWGKITLLWKGLMQAFSSGELSGAVLNELEKVENQGILEFIIWIHSAWIRLKAIVDGIKEGFVAGLKPLEPLFAQLTASFLYLADQMGFGSNGIAASIGRLPFASFKEFGKTVGEAAANIVGWVLKVWIVLSDLVGGLVGGLVSSFGFFSKSFDGVGASARGFWNALKILFAPLQELFSTTESNTSVWQSIGKVIGWVAGTVIAGLAEGLSIVIDVLSLVVLAVTLVIKGLIWLGTTIGEVIGDGVNLFYKLPEVWEKVKDSVKSVGVAIKEAFLAAFDYIHDRFDRLLGISARVLDKIPGLRSQFKDFIDLQRVRSAELDSGEGASVRRRQNESFDSVGALASPGGVAAEAASQQSISVVDAVNATGAKISSQPIEVRNVMELEGTELFNYIQKFTREGSLSSFEDG
jgi:hypothetical protein